MPQTAGFTAVEFLKGSSQCIRAGSLLLHYGHLWGLSLVFLLSVMTERSGTLHSHIMKGIKGLCDEFLSRQLEMD